MAKKRSTKRAGKKPTRSIGKTQRARLAGSLIDQVELTSIRVIEIHGLMNFEGSQLPTGDTNIRVETGWEINEKQEILLSNVTLFIEGKPQEGSSSSLTLVVRHQLVFALETISEIDTIREEQDHQIKELSVRIAWPYLREFVQSLTARMGLPHLTLPLMRFGKSPDAQAAKPKKKAGRKKK